MLSKQTCTRTAMVSNIPAGWKLAYTDLVSAYIAGVFAVSVGLSLGPCLPPLSLPLALVEECLITAQVLVQAYRNPCTQRSSIDYVTDVLKYLITELLDVVKGLDIDRYCHKLPKTESLSSVKTTLKKMAKRYPPRDPPIVLSQPCVIIDRHDRIIAWYLPNIITLSRQVSDQYISHPWSDDQQQMLYQSTGHLHRAFQHNTSRPSRAENSMWRLAETHFKPRSSCVDVPPGTVNMAPAWFQQAHDVSTSLLGLPRPSTTF